MTEQDTHPSNQYSIVIPTRDTRQLVERCLDAIETRGRVDLEVLVVDDGSRDGTAEMVRRRDPRVRLVELTESVGFAQAANRGLEAARGDVLVLLNSDTEVEPGGLEALAAALEDDPLLGVAGGSLFYPDGTAQWCGGREPDLPWLFALTSGLPQVLAHLPGWRRLRSRERRHEVGVDWVTGAAMAVRREVWRELGPLDASFRFYCQDLDFCLRAKRSGWRVAVVPGFRVLHHHGATIRKASGGGRRQNSELLWIDLVHWAWKHRGPRWARKARRVMLCGVRLRLLARALVGWFLPGSSGESWRRDTLAYRRAHGALEEMARTLEGPRAEEALSPLPREDR